MLGLVHREHLDGIWPLARGHLHSLVLVWSMCPMYKSDLINTFSYACTSTWNNLCTALTLIEASKNTPLTAVMPTCCREHCNLEQLMPAVISKLTQAAPAAL